jgi:PIN domain
MFRILIDTCVWLDLAKDYQQQPILTALEELIRLGEIELILPRTVLDEFARNKAHVIEESSSLCTAGEYGRLPNIDAERQQRNSHVFGGCFLQSSA